MATHRTVPSTQHNLPSGQFYNFLLQRYNIKPILTVGFSKASSSLSQQSHKPVPGKETGWHKERRKLNFLDGNTKNSASEETFRELLLKQVFAMIRP